MRLFVGGLVIMATGLGGCAAISGLGDYGEGTSIDPDSSTSQLVKDSGPFATDGNDVPDTGTPSDDTADPDGDPVNDAAGLADVNPDSAPACSTITCGGCCMNGECVGGQSVSTCGKGGGLCKDCSGMGGGCSTAGACIPYVDSGPPPTCDKSKCPPCIPVYQSTCCIQPAQTCGCITNFGGGSCK